jgi:hypothetical protein
MMTIPEIIHAIHELAEEHRHAGNDIDDLKDTEWLESRGFQLIIDHCLATDLLVNGFPANIEEGFLGEEEVTDEHWQLYIDLLTIDHPEIAELHFEWTRAFWPEEFTSQEDWLESIQARVNSSFYSIHL